MEEVERRAEKRSAFRHYVSLYFAFPCLQIGNLTRSILRVQPQSLRRLSRLTVKK